MCFFPPFQHKAKSKSRLKVEEEKKEEKSKILAEMDSLHMEKKNREARFVCLQ